MPREGGFAEDGTHLKKKCISGHKKCKIGHLTRSGILVDVRTHLGILRLLCTEITPYHGNPSHTERDFGDVRTHLGIPGLLCTEITLYHGNPYHTERDFGECALTSENSEPIVKNIDSCWQHFHRKSSPMATEWPATASSCKS